MNKLMEKQIHEDYKEVLSSDAGLRVFGGIFSAARLTKPGPLNDYMQGRRDLGLAIANTLREINPHLVAECELAYEDFRERCKDDERRDNDGGDW